LESSNIDSSLQPATSGPNAKKVKTTTASPAKLPKTERRKGHSTYQPNQRGEVMEQPDTRASRTQQWQPSSAQVQSSRHGSASAYGNPSTGEIRGNPYFVDPRNTHGRPGGPYPVIEGYNTPSSAYDSQPTFDDSNAVDYHRIHPQHQTPSQRRRRAATDSATSSAYPPSSKYDTQNPNKSFRASAHEQGRGNPKSDDDSSESDFTLAKTKRMKKKT